LYEAGNFEAAINALQQAAQNYKKQGDDLRQAIALSNLALAYQQLGQWQEASRAIGESVGELEGVGSGEKIGNHAKIQNPKSKIQNLPFLAQALEIQGDGQLEMGQADLAIATWQRAEAIYQQLNNLDGVTRSRINQAQALRKRGYYRRALAILTDLHQTLLNPAQQNPNSQSSADPLTQAIGLRSLGNDLRLAGDLPQSRQVLQESLQIAKRLQSPQEISASLFSLGNTARAQQDTATATTHYQSAAQIAPTAIGKIQAQINLFSLLVSTNPTAAKSVLTELQTQLPNLPASQSGIYAHIHLAQALMKFKIQNPKSKISSLTAQLLATAVQQSRELGDLRGEAHALGNLGSVYEQSGQWQSAQDLTEQALKLAQGLNAPDIAYRWHWQLARLLKQQWEQSGRTLPEARERAISAYDAAITEIQSLRGDLVAVNRDVQFSFRESVEPIYRESVELLVQPQNGQKNGQTSQENLNTARQQMEALQLAELDNFFREACLDARPVLLDKVVDQDNPTTAILYPIILPNQLEVIVKIPRQPLHHHTIRKTRQEVEAVLTELQRNLTELDATDKVQTLSQQLYTWLIQPIDRDLEKQGVNTLVFVLDGSLRSIPMAGLYDGKQYLVEKYAIALSLGLQLLRPKALATEQLNVLAAGLVEPPPAFRQFPPLPEIRSEFEFIAKTGVATQQLLDQEFTSQSLENQVKATRYNVVHLATHGQFSSDAKNTFILAADGPINVTQLDALLRGRSQSQARAIELLVLSACQTAEGDDRAALGLAGIAVKAGARSTLASLWQIDDRSTAILIGEFYRELAKAKVTKAEALRRAQISLLRDYPNYSRPSYWAPYVLVGNWL
jgi:CHAT domain-containing protein